MLMVDMPMPKNNCEMAVEIKGVGDWCPIMAEVCDYYSTKKMPDWCPIKGELPEEHGDLIDRDALKEKKVYSHERHEYVVPVAYIDWEQAVIAAEKKDDEQDI